VGPGRESRLAVVAKDAAACFRKDARIASNIMTRSHVVDIEWDERKNRLNQNKHRLSFAEAATVFADPLEVAMPDPDHSAREDRFISIGQSSGLRLLVVSYTEREGRIRIINARRPTKTERRAYEEN
jgi:uncharacterized DUF497 family protein